MATDPVNPPPKTPAEAHHYDEHSGVYGFFRRHQKKLLYTAGMFVLLTFSISGPMTQWVRDRFTAPRQMPTIKVNGAPVSMTEEDFYYGQQLAHAMYVALPGGVLPPLRWPPVQGDNELHDVLAILRRAAIAEGIEPSLQEVDKAIASLVKQRNAESPSKLARTMSYASLAQYRAVVAEAMRVGTYVRLQSLAVDTSDARVLHAITDQEEKITLRVATFDEKKAEEGLKASPVSEDDLKKWLESKTERDKHQMKAYDVPRAELRFEALLLAEGQFDPEQWKDGCLKDFVVSDDQIKNAYNQERENRFKIDDTKSFPFTAKAEDDQITAAAHGLTEGTRITVANSGGALPTGLAAATNYYVRDVMPDAFKVSATPGGAAVDLTADGSGTQTATRYPDVVRYREFDDPTVKPEVTRLLQAQRVINEVMGTVRAKQAEAIKPQTEAFTKAQTELGTGHQTAAECARVTAEKTKDVASKKAELEKKPADDALKAALKEAEQAETAAKDAQKEADGKIEGLKKAVADAQTALEAARAAFDFRPAFAEATKDKKGFVEKATSGRKTADELKDLDALGLELGKWPVSTQGASMRNKGDMSFQPANTSKAVAAYQATDVEPLPLKPWDQLKTIAEGAYWTEQAKKLGEDKKKLMEETLLRLAKGKIPEKVAEIEGKKQQRIDAKLTEWETKLTAAIDEAEKKVLTLAPGTQAYAGWQQELGAKKAELGQKDAQKASFETMVGKEIEGEIATEARKFYKDVLDEAAAAAGFTVADHGPFVRDLQQRPRFENGYDAPVVFLWKSQSKMAEGEATDVLQDTTNRAFYVAVCTKVEPMTAADVTRREFQEKRNNGRWDFAAEQAYQAFTTAFTLEAVEKRYEFKREVGEAKQAKK